MLVEAQRRADNDTAQATAARLNAELEIALANVLVSPCALQFFVFTNSIHLQHVSLHSL